MIKLSLLALIAHSTLTGAIPTSNNHTRLVPVADYSFSCDSNGNSKVSCSPSSLLGDLVNLESTRCNFVTNGVSSVTTLKSNATVAALRQHFMNVSATGVTFKVWATPSVNHDLTKSRPILTIGGYHYQDDDDGYNQCRNTEFYMGIRGNLLEIRYYENDFRLTCRILLVRQKNIYNNKLIQIVVTMTQDSTNVYFDGEPIIEGARNSLKTNLTMWNPDSTLQLFSSTLDLFSDRFIHQPFAGTLHQVSIYDQALDRDQIALTYSEELLGKQQNIIEREPLHLVALAEPVDVIQGRSSTVRIGGLNRSTHEYSVQVEILLLPMFGDILSAKGTVHTTGYRIPFSGSARKVVLLYRCWSDFFFTTPKFSYRGKDLQRYPEVFEYRLVAVDADGELLGWSEPVKQELNIRHVNQPPTLVIPKSATLLAVQSTSLASRPLATIPNVTLKDLDQNIDRVRVDVWALNGTLEILNYLDLADFDSCAKRSGYPWNCFGKGGLMGSKMRNMTFVATPSDVSFILSSLRYEGFKWDQEDSIVIRIFDGSGDPCLREEEHKYDSIHDGCYEISATVSVPAMSRPPRKFDVSNISLPQVIFMGIVLVVLLACCQFIRLLTMVCKYCLFKPCRAAARWGSRTYVFNEQSSVFDEEEIIIDDDTVSEDNHSMEDDRLESEMMDGEVFSIVPL